MGHFWKVRTKGLADHFGNVPLCLAIYPAPEGEKGTEIGSHQDPLGANILFALSVFTLYSVPINFRDECSPQSSVQFFFEQCSHYKGL